MRVWVFAVLILLAVGQFFSEARADAWEDAYDPATKTRFIPVELWTGAKWDGRRDLEMTPASLKFGKNLDKEIDGPKPWTNPVNGAQHQVYERSDKGKIQLFTVRSDKIGMGRVFDSRGNRSCEPGFKFPLGLWKQGESRTVEFICWKEDGKAYPRTMTIVIEEIDFVYAGAPHALRFHWIADGGKGDNLNNAYTYVPFKGDVRIEKR